MINHPYLQIPFRSKLDMLNDIVQIVCCLHEGNRKQLENCINDLKLRALFMDAEIQNSVLVFTDQVHFQFNFDPCHKVTVEVQQAADRLIEAMGFTPPPK